MKSEPEQNPEAEDGGDGESVNAVAERQFEAIRHALTERRRAINMTMSELGRIVGVSPSLISQIERGQTLPSVGTLFALAAALGVTVDAFLTEPEPRADAPAPDPENVELGPLPGPDEVLGMPATAREAMYLVRRHARASVPIRGGVTWERLTPRSLEDVEFLELNYAPQAESDDQLYRHPGIEMVLVLEGRFEIHVGFETYLLEEGDSILFPSSLPHRYVNPTDETARAVTVILRDGIGSAIGPEGASSVEDAAPPAPPEQEE
ncbi:MAG TPA: XRE family transcriptional regulator [Solirubrobacterales bacterium]|nr:XRE family transcriptional regulator [Solirubrobacterales bacterium]